MTQDLNMMNPLANQPEQRGGRKAALRLLDWILGSVPQETQALAEPPVHDIQVESQLTTSWLQSFGAALTEATQTFVLNNVEPLYRDCDRTRFVVSRVKVDMRQSASGCLSAVQKLPSGMRNTMALLRIQKAKGATEQLMLDRFYGLSILAEEGLETVVDDQVVETMVSYGGSRVLIRFVFEGEYLMLPERPAIPLASDTGRSPASDAVSTAEPAKQFERHSAPHSPSHRPSPSTLAKPGSAETLLYRPKTPGSATWRGNETQLYVPSRPARTPLLKLQLCADGANTVVDLFAEGFPYTVGRHANQAGFSVRAANQTVGEAIDTGLVAQAHTTESLCYVSRDHLVLHLPDMQTGEIPVDNLAAQRGRNGTYLNGEAQPPRFIHLMHSRQPLRLGAPRGQGTLDLRLETV
jgi:hypothetical protein